MSITTQLADSYSPSVLDAIEQAFSSVWETLYAHVSSDNRQAEE